MVGAADDYADAASRWFGARNGPAALRAAIDAGVHDTARDWQDLRAFGFGELVAAEKDPAVRAALVSAIAKEAGRHLYAGPLIEAVGPEILDIPRGEPDTLIIAVLEPIDAPGRTPGGDIEHPAAPYAAAAERFIVAEVADAAGVRSLEAGTDGIDVTMLRQSDGTTSDRVRIDARTFRAAPRMHVPGEAVAEMQRLLWLSTAARLIGVAERVSELAREHLMTRTQYGRPLAAFQTLQHQAVDRHIDLTLADALLDPVAAHWCDDAVRRPALHALASLAPGVAIACGKTAVQHLGAMGFAHEADVGLYLRHAITLACRHGDALAHGRAFAGSSAALFAT